MDLGPIYVNDGLQPGRVPESSQYRVPGMGRCQRRDIVDLETVAGSYINVDKIVELAGGVATVTTPVRVSDGSGVVSGGRLTLVK